MDRCKIYLFCGHTRQVLYVNSLVFKNCHLLHWRALPLSSTSMPSVIGGQFRISTRKHLQLWTNTFAAGTESPWPACGTWCDPSFTSGSLVCFYTASGVHSRPPRPLHRIQSRLEVAGSQQLFRGPVDILLWTSISSSSSLDPFPGREATLHRPAVGMQ